MRGKNSKKQPRKAKARAGAVARKRKITLRNDTLDVAASTSSGQGPDSMLPAVPAEPKVPALPAETEESKEMFSTFFSWINRHAVSTIL